MNMAQVIWTKAFVAQYTSIADPSRSPAWEMGVPFGSNRLLHLLPALENATNWPITQRHLLNQATNWYKIAVFFLPDYGEAWLRLGISDFGSGTQGDAEAALQRAAALMPQSRMAHIMLGDAYTRRGDPLKGISEYREAGYWGRERQTASIYLELAMPFLNNGDDASARPYLEQALEIWPASLSASYHLARITKDPAWYSRLSYFDIAGIDPLDMFTIEAVVDLARSGLWDQELVSRVVNYSLAHADSESVNTLLLRLLEVYPEDSRLRFYLAEGSHRQGKWKRAVTEYRHVLDLTPNFASAYFRIGQIEELSEVTDSRRDLAIDWYQQYHERVPRDLHGLRKLVELEKGKQSVAAEQRKAELMARTDDRFIVANLLGIAREDVELGPNLIENGSFETWNDNGQEPKSWARLNQSSGGPWYPAAFDLSADGLIVYTGTSAARIDGLWVQRDPARAGYLYWNDGSATGQAIGLDPRAAYALSFYYRTDGLAEIAEVSTEDVMKTFGTPVADSFCITGCRLPGTSGEWHHVVFLDWNNSDRVAPIGLALLNYGPGTVWFDQVSLYTVEAHYEGARIIQTFLDQ